MERVLKINRESLKNHAGLTIWFTGLPASGKSTLARLVEIELFESGHHTYLMDADHIRKSLNRDLGFSPEDRSENMRRISEVARMFNQAGIISLVASICPYEEDREMVKDIIGAGFILVFLDCPVSVCEERDPKGLYKRARDGKIKFFTGIDDPYEIPVAPDVHLRTNVISEVSCVSMMIGFLNTRSFM